MKDVRVFAKALGSDTVSTRRSLFVTLSQLSDANVSAF